MPATLRRSYGGRQLTRDDAQRRGDVGRIRADMRKSPAWRRALALLQSICLLTGHVRPVSKHQAWMTQSPVMPGDPSASAAARARDVATNFAEAFSMSHPMSGMADGLSPDVRAAVAWHNAAWPRRAAP